MILKMNIPYNWPFSDSPNVAVFTSKKILSGEDDICYVTHDKDDGAWQFHPLCGTDEVDATVVGLNTICEIDTSILTLAFLPQGWIAWRRHKGEEWQKSPQ